MRRLALIIAVTGLLCGPLLAQQSSSKNDPQSFAPPPPPPGMNDPGVSAKEAAQVRPPKVVHGEISPASITPTRMPGQTLTIRDPAHPEGAPVDTQDGVETSQQGQNKVQTFRRAGQVYMVVITPRYGPPQTYYVHPRDAATPNGRSNVQPPMYTLFQWGKPQKPVNPEADQDGD